MSRVFLGVYGLRLLFSQKKLLETFPVEFLIYYSPFYKYDYCHIKIYNFVNCSHAVISLILKHIVQNGVVILSFKFM
jgi:hypothetical protein